VSWWGSHGKVSAETIRAIAPGLCRICVYWQRVHFFQFGERSCSKCGTRTEEFGTKARLAARARGNYSAEQWVSDAEEARGGGYVMSGNQETRVNWRGAPLSATTTRGSFQ
jgi:hypothetical protein